MPETALPGCHANHPGISCLNEGKPGAYCAPKRCYCGSCPWFLPIDVMPTYTPDVYTAFDRKAIVTGHRRSNLGTYRDAQQQQAAVTTHG